MSQCLICNGLYFIPVSKKALQGIFCQSDLQLKGALSSLRHAALCGNSSKNHFNMCIPFGDEIAKDENQRRMEEGETHYQYHHRSTTHLFLLTRREKILKRGTVEGRCCLLVKVSYANVQHDQLLTLCGRKKKKKSDKAVVLQSTVLGFHFYLLTFLP